MKLRFLSLFAIAAMLLVACEKKNGREEAEKVDPLTQAEQKEELEAIGLELVDYADLANWGDAFTSVVNFVKVMEDGSNDMSAFEHLEETGIFGTNKHGDGDNAWENYGWVCDYREPYVRDNREEETIQFSKFNGKYALDASKKAWVYTPATSFSIEADVEGKPVSVTAKIEDGSNKLLASYSKREEVNAWKAYQTGPAMYGQMVHNQQYDYDEFVYESRQNGSGNTEYHIYNPVTKQDLGWITETELLSAATRTMVNVPAGEQKTIEGSTTYIYMPGSIKATFTEASNKLADLDFSIKYTGADASVLDLSSDTFVISGTFEASGYTLKSEHTDYLKDNAQVSYVLSRGKDDIISIDVKEKGLSIKRDEYNRINGQSEYENTSWSSTSSGVSYDFNTEPETLELTVDVLGKLLLKGTCDYARIARISDEMEKSRDNEATFKSWVGQAEQNFNLEAFYNGSTERSAYLGLEPVQKQGNDGKTSWDVVPVIRFTDGSAYAVFEAFFNETDFADLITAIDNWEKSVEEFMNKLFSKEEAQPDPGQPE